jgi:hypothetical protein
MTSVTTRSLIRWTGPLAIFAGVLLLILGILPSLLLPARQPVLEWVLDDAWPALSVLAFVLALLMPLTLTGLYAGEVEETGRLGLLGYLIAFLGLLLFAAFQFDLAFVWPVLAAQAPELIDFSGPMFRDPPFSVVHSVMGPLHAVGIVVFGVATYRGRVFPRSCAVLFTIGIVLSAGILLPPLIIRPIGAVPAAVALAWMGYTLWRTEHQAPAAG